MTVTYQVINLSDGGGSENLLINPRGKINQANESDGVLSAGQYFCDGWKAGAAGAEVYRDSDGFRLISGSILQLVPNNLDASQPIKGNMDVISGAPAIRINGGTDSESSDTQTYITFEVIGNNSKFTRLILAESESLPVYQQSQDELKPCQRFIQVLENPHIDTYGSADYTWLTFPERMFQTPAWTPQGGNMDGNISSSSVNPMSIVVQVASPSPIWTQRILLDARL
ncbi:hypothetical protein CWN94_11695 [Vibrio splendidus]|uniref:hypothetical protein n=1 Tax=Vibrio splendidus TaxID=29497 RepID=UPI000D39F09D|nr:hypothetical protein [Vibrio splendidus]PTO54060.1 hypothetical protein CWN94_11695 [Vibrio splendidus]